MASVRASLDNFVSAAMTPVAFGKGPRNVALRRLEASGKQRPVVWEFRTTTPRPGARLFGCFAAADAFVGSALEYRDDISFDEECRKAEAAWNQLFPSHQPVVSENLNDYLTSNVERIR